MIPSNIAGVGGLSALFNVIAAAVCTAGLLRIVRAWASERLLDVPNARSSHSVPTPRGGGIAIVVVVIFGLALLSGHKWSSELIALLVGGSVIAIVSWIDDLKSLPAALRLAAHTTCAVIAVGFIGRWRFMPVNWGLAATATEWIVSVCWLVGLTNAYNFMDGIDGIAGTQALIASAGFITLGYQMGLNLLVVCGLLVFGATAAFLLQNWHPARIFMGDVGSAFLGFTFGALSLIATHGGGSLLSGVVLLWPFLFDTSFTIILRLRRHENIFAAHRSHLYQRMVIAGMSHARVASLYGIAAMISLPFAVWPFHEATSRAVAVFGVFAAGGATIWIVTKSAEANWRKVADPGT